MNNNNEREIENEAKLISPLSITLLKWGFSGELVALLVVNFLKQLSFYLGFDKKIAIFEINMFLKSETAKKQAHVRLLSHMLF